MRRESCPNETPEASSEVGEFSHFALLSRVSHLLNRSDQDALDGILQLLLSRFRSEFGILGYIDGQGRLVCPTLTRDVWNRCAMSNKRIVFEISELGGVLEEVLRDRRTVVANSPRPVPSGHVPIRNFLGVPVVSEDSLIGCILLANSAQGYSDQDARFLGRIGDYLAPIMEAWRKRLDEERRREQAERELRESLARLRRSMSRFRVLAAISDLVDGDTDEESVAQAVVEMLADATAELPNAAIRLILHGRVHQPRHFEETPNKISAGIFVDCKYVGAVELCFGRSGLDDEDIRQEQLFLTQAAEKLGTMLSRRRAQEEIATARRHLQVLLETTKIGLSVIDENEIVRYMDPWQKKIYGDFEGTSVQNYFRVRNVRDDQWVHSVLEALRERRKVTFQHPIQAQEDAIAQTTAIPFQDPATGSWQIATITIDLTEQKRLESALAHARRMEAVGQLAAGIAHEINTPIQYIGDNLSFLGEAFDQVFRLIEAMHRAVDTLGTTAVESYSQLLRSFDWDYHREEVPKALEESKKGVEQVSHIVRAMKVFSHPGGRDKQEVDLHRMLQAAIDISRNEWKNVATLRTEFDPGVGPVPLFSAEFNMAVVNLIVNAAQAIAERPDLSSRPGMIIVRTKALDENWVEIQVEDNGPGIPKEIQDRVFDAFFTTKEVGKGTGQGLTTAHHAIVTQHGGTLEFRSRPGEGTLFLIRIPRKRPTAIVPPKNSTITTAVPEAEKAALCAVNVPG